MLIRKLAERDAVSVLNPEYGFAPMVDAKGAKAAIAPETVDAPADSFFDGSGSLALGQERFRFFGHGIRILRDIACILGG